MVSNCRITIRAERDERVEKSYDFDMVRITLFE